MRLRLGAAALCMVLLLTGCGAAAQESSSDTGIKAEVPSASADIFAMDTYMTVTCYGERCEEAVSYTHLARSRSASSNRKSPAGDTRC